MSVILVFLFMIISFAVWWLARQRILSKPWLEPGVAGPYAHGHYQCRFSRSADLWLAAATVKPPAG